MCPLPCKLQQLILAGFCRPLSTYHTRQYMTSVSLQHELCDVLAKRELFGRAAVIRSCCTAVCSAVHRPRLPTHAGASVKCSSEYFLLLHCFFMLLLFLGELHLLASRHSMIPHPASAQLIPRRSGEQKALHPGSADACTASNCYYVTTVAFEMSPSTWPLEAENQIRFNA
jgi:hypothetical protein